MKRKPRFTITLGHFFMGLGFIWALWITGTVLEIQDRRHGLAERLYVLHGEVSDIERALYKTRAELEDKGVLK